MEGALEQTARDFIDGLNELPKQRVVLWMLRISHELDRLGILTDEDRQRTTELLDKSVTLKAARTA